MMHPYRSAWTPWSTITERTAQHRSLARPLSRPLARVGLDFSFSPEGEALIRALDFEKQGQKWIPDPNHPAYTYGKHTKFHPEYSYQHFYEDAAKQWSIARDLATQIAFATASDPPPTSNDAALRAAAYETRRLADLDVVSGKTLRPSPSFKWPAIPQSGDTGPSSGFGTGGAYPPIGPASGTTAEPLPESHKKLYLAAALALFAAGTLLYLYQPRLAARMLTRVTP